MMPRGSRRRCLLLVVSLVAPALIVAVPRAGPAEAGHYGNGESRTSVASGVSRTSVASGVSRTSVASGVSRTTLQDTKPSIAFFFRAIGSDGQPVADLKPADVSLKVGGAARTIRSLVLKEFSKAGETAPGAPASPITAPFVTNRTASAGGREIFLVIDDLSISPGGIGTVKEALKSVLDAASPRDRVGLLSVRPGGVNIAPTLDHSKISLAVSDLTGQRGSADTCRSAAIVETLRTLVEESAGPSPATVAFLSSGYAGNMSGPNCAIRPEDLRLFGTSVQRANTSLYFIQAIDGSGGSLSTWIDSVAGASGAELFRITGSNPASAARVVRETAALYRVTLDKENSDRNGTTARVDIRVARPNVKVYAPPGLTFSISDSAATTPTTAAVLRTTAEFTDVPLRAAAYLSRDNTAEGFKIVAAFEPTDPSITLASAAIGLFDSNGQSSARWTGRRSDFTRSPILAGFPVASGRYRMRIAAIDASGRAGAVDLPIVAALSKAGPMSLSALVLGVMQDGAFAPRLQFGAEPEAVAYFEIYDAAGGAAPAIRFELAPATGGPVLTTVPGSLQRSAAGGALIVSAALPIGSLPPGDTLVRAMVNLDDKPIGQALATLRKVRP